MVDVDRQHTDGLTEALGTVQLVLKPDAQEASIAETREVVVLGAAAELVEELGVPDREAELVSDGLEKPCFDLRKPLGSAREAAMTPVILP